MYSWFQFLIKMCYKFWFIFLTNIENVDTNIYIPFNRLFVTVYLWLKDVSVNEKNKYTSFQPEKKEKL